MKKNLAFIILTTLLVECFAQNNLKENNPTWCGTDLMIQEYLKNNPDAQNQIYETIQAAKKKGLAVNQKATIVVPTVVHVMHNNFKGFISKAQVRDGIRIMSEDYSKRNADTVNTRTVFKPVVGNPEIEFRLATKDPNGNCTDGIVYVNTPLADAANDGMKSLSAWPSNRYFNIWLVNNIDLGGGGGGTIIGYGQFPGQGSWSTYGYVNRNDAFGSIGSAQGGDGRTPTHEAGHCFGLLHTFQGGCGSNCSNSGDYICDTPPVNTATYGCSQTQNTCSNDASGQSPFGTNVVDQIENYMSYDACQNMFTLEQSGVMKGVFTQFSQLSNLVSSANLIATGTQNGAPASNCAPIADFDYNYEMICAGQTVKFTHYSWNGQPTTWNWTFPGGTPPNSTDSNPTITYNTPGKFDVTLQASNSGGSGSRTKTGIILVSSTTAQYGTGPFTEGFENATSFNADWIIIDKAGRKWELNNVASTSGTSSARILNYIGASGDIDDLISPSYNMSGASGSNLTFKLAFKQKNTSNTDRLRVYVSTDCGKTWQLRYSKQGSQLSTVTSTSSVSFTPAANDWREETINLSAYASATNIRIKFEFLNGGGNNIYIDDINIGSPTSIEETNLVNNTMNIYPNPSNGNSIINFELSENANVSLKIIDVLGKIVATPFEKNQLQSGVHNINLQSSLAKGTYIVTLNVNEKQVSKRLVIQ